MSTEQKLKQATAARETAEADHAKAQEQATEAEVELEEAGQVLETLQRTVRGGSTTIRDATKLRELTMRKLEAATRVEAAEGLLERRERILSECGERLQEANTAVQLAECQLAVDEAHAAEEQLRDGLRQHLLELRAHRGQLVETTTRAQQLCTGLRGTGDVPRLQLRADARQLDEVLVEVFRAEVLAGGPSTYLADEPEPPRRTYTQSGDTHGALGSYAVPGPQSPEVEERLAAQGVGTRSTPGEADDAAAG